MLADYKISQIFVMSDDFCKVFDSMPNHRGYHPSRIEPSVSVVFILP